MYDLDTHVAELYDQLIIDTEDIALIRRLIGPRKREARGAALHGLCPPSHLLDKKAGRRRR